MTKVLGFACNCGALRGSLRDIAPGAGCHLVCYCADCRAAAHHFGVDAALEPGGGSPLFQTLPSRVTISQGGEHLACLRLSPKGLHRWYAACCNTPIGNTVATPKVPLVGLWRPIFDDPAALGPVQSRVFTKFARPGGPTKDRGVATMSWGFIRRSATAYLAGKVHPHPFFDADGQPNATPVVLSAAERDAARLAG